MGLFGGSSKSSVKTTQISNDNRQDNRRYSDSRQSTVTQTDARRFVDRRVNQQADSRQFHDNRQTNTTVDNTRVEAGGINSGGAVTITDGGIVNDSLNFAKEAFNFAEVVAKDLNKSVKDVVAGQQASTDSIVEKTLNNTAGTLAATGQRNMLLLMGIMGAAFVVIMWLGSR